MIDIDIIEQTIDELEHGDTTFFNCQNLASLYIVREHLKRTNLDKELYDVIPAYKKYCSVKKSYQVNEMPEEAIVQSISTVCKELKDFIIKLYNNTDSEAERICIINTLSELYDTHKSP